MKTAMGLMSVGGQGVGMAFGNPAGYHANSDRINHSDTAQFLPLAAKPSQADVISPASRIIGASFNGVSRGLSGKLAQAAVATGIMGFSGNVYAADLPAFNADQHVYCVPSCPFNTDQLEKSLEGTTFPSYVIFYSRYDGSRGGDREDWTITNVDKTVDQWQTQNGFDAQYATVVGRLWDESVPDTDGGASRGFHVTHPSAFVSSIGPRRLDDEHVRLQDNHFFPKWENARDFGGAFAEYATAVDAYYVMHSGLSVVRDGFNSQIAMAKQTVQNPLISEADAAALRTLISAAEKTAAAEYNPEIITKAKRDLESVLRPIQSEIERREKNSLSLSQTIGKVESAFSSPEVSAQDKTSTLQSALSRGRSALAGKNFAEMELALKELEQSSEKLLKEIPQREAARVELNKAITMGKSTLANSEIKSFDDVETLKSALLGAEKLKSSHDYEAIRLSTVSLTSATNVLEGVISERLTAKRDLSTLVSEIEFYRVQNSAYLGEIDITDLDAMSMLAAEKIKSGTSESIRSEREKLQYSFSSIKKQVEALKFAEREREIARRDLHGLLSEIDGFRRENSGYLKDISTSALDSEIESSKKSMTEKSAEKIRLQQETLDQVFGEVENKVDAAVAAHQRRVTLGIAGVLSGLGLAAAGTVYAVSRQRRYEREKAETERLLAEWKQKIEDGEDRLADFNLNRDAVSAMIHKNGKTRELYDEVTKLIDELMMGLQGLRSRVDAAQTEYAKSGLAAMLRAKHALTTPFVYTVDDANAGRLFDKKRTQIQINPADFANSLAEKYDQARQLWEKILAAVAATKRSAREDFTTKDLESMKVRLAGAGLSESWLKHHPLYGDAEKVWQDLESVRLVDPVSYLDKLHDAIEDDDALEETVADLVASFTKVAELKAEAESIVLTENSVVTDTNLDPQAMTGVIAEQYAAYLAALAKGMDAEGENAAAVFALEKTLEESYREWMSRKKYLIEVQKRVRQALVDARAKVESIDAKIDAEESRVEGDKDNQTGNKVDTAIKEISEARWNYGEALAKLSDAEKALAENNHLRADQLINDAFKEIGQAENDYVEYGQARAAYEKDLLDFAELLSKMDAKKDSTRSKIASQYSKADYKDELAAYDTKLSRIKNEANMAGPKDYAEFLRRLQGLSRDYDVLVDEAKKDHERRERDSYRSSSYSDYGYSSSRSRSSGYSGGGYSGGSSGPSGSSSSSRSSSSSSSSGSYGGGWGSSSSSSSSSSRSSGSSSSSSRSSGDDLGRAIGGLISAMQKSSSSSSSSSRSSSSSSGSAWGSFGSSSRSSSSSSSSRSSGGWGGSSSSSSSSRSSGSSSRSGSSSHGSGSSSRSGTSRHR